MNAEYVNPFIEASQNVLQQMVGLEVTLGKLYLKSSPYKGAEIAVIVGLTGKIRGQVMFGMTEDTAKSVASRMMGGMPVPELDEISKSAISELTNMILGNTATIFYNKGVGVEITPPSFLMGENMQISSSKMRTMCVPLMMEGEVIIELDISIID